MAAAINALELLQAGIEAVPGTLVPATYVIVADEGGRYVDRRDRQVLPQPRGVLAEVEHVVVMNASELSISMPLSFEDVLLPLLTGVETATPDAGPPKLWTFEPTLTLPTTLKAATYEVSYTDGTTRHYEKEFGFGTCRSFEIGIRFGELATLTMDIFGRKAQASTLTAGRAPLARELIPSALFGLFIDANWAGIGGTAKAGVIRSATVTVNGGVEPDFSLAARSDLDFTQLRRGMVTGSVSLVAEFDATAGAEVAAYEAGTARFIQLKALGSDSRSLKLDMVVRYIEPPAVSVEDGLRVVTLNGRFMFDPTSGRVFRAIVANALATF